MPHMMMSLKKNFSKIVQNGFSISIQNFAGGGEGVYSLLRILTPTTALSAVKENMKEVTSVR